MPIRFAASDDLPAGVLAYLDRQAGETVVLISYGEVEALDAEERMQVLCSLFDAADRPSPGRLRDELAAMRRRQQLRREACSQLVLKSHERLSG